MSHPLEPVVYPYKDLDAELCALGSTTRSEDPAALAIFDLLYKKANYRMARGHSIARRVNPWLNLKSALHRGEFEEAEILMKSLQAPALDLHSRAELLLEKTRLHCFEGNWAGARVLAEELAMLQTLEGSDFLTFLQVRAIIHFELGAMRLCLQDLQSIESLSSLYPHAPSLFYARVLKARVLARSSSLMRARFETDSVWLELKKSGQLSIDQLLTLSRCEIDLARLENLPSRKWAELSLQCSALLGDSLYLELAELDLLATCQAVSTTAGLFTFARTKRLLSESQQEVSGALTSTTAQALKLQKTEAPTCSSPEPALLAFTRQRLIYDLKTGSPVDSAVSSQSWTALEALRGGPLEKGAFFKKVWNRRSYSMRLHDPNVRNLLHRLRKQSGIEISTADATIDVKNCWVF